MKMKDYIGYLVDIPCSDDPIDLGEGKIVYNHYWSRRPDIVKDKKTGEMRKTKFKYLLRVPNWNGLCYTITSRSFKHPLLDRAMSVRENATIQSFPDDFIFIGTKTNAQRQIGNAVPPKMAKAIAENIMEMIE